MAAAIEVLCKTLLDRGSWLSKAPVTPGLRPCYDLPATENGPIVEITYAWSQRSYDWPQRSCVIARGKSVAASSWSCSKPSNTGLTTRLRPTGDRKKLQSWANLRKNVRLVAEVVRLVSDVAGDRKGQISRNKVDSHVQNWSCHLSTGGTTNRLLTHNLRGPRLIERSIVYGYH